MSVRRICLSMIVLVIAHGCTSIPAIPDSSKCVVDTDCHGGELCEEGRCTPIIKDVTSAAMAAAGAESPSTAGEANSPSDAAASGTQATPNRSDSNAAAAGDAAKDPPPSAASSGGAQAPSNSAGAAGAAGSTLRCTADACLGGVCKEEGASFRCECGSGWENDGPQRCRKLDVCAGNCKPGGECAETSDGFTCTCFAGFLGTGTKSCTNIDECAGAGKACAPGMCVDGINSYTCMCPPGFLGNGGTQCIEACPARACEPGGTCIDGPAGWQCNCELATYDPKECPDELLGEHEIKNSKTGLTWYWGCLFINRPTAGDAEAATEARDFCDHPQGTGASPSGYRWASKDEVEVAPAQIARYGPGQCAFTPQGLHCAADEDPNGAKVKILCLR
jgi:hypothetical protein